MAGGATLMGDKELEKLFQTLGERVERKITRQAVNVALTPCLKSARAKVKKESGLLEESLDKKIKTYPESMTVVGLVGPNTAVSGEYEGELRVPWRYAHLVEDGHIDRAGNFVPPQPFLRPAFDETQGQMLDVMETRLGKGIEREAAKRD
jgi:HK97 gp10 family phage protein